MRRIVEGCTDAESRALQLTMEDAGVGVDSKQQGKLMTRRSIRRHALRSLVAISAWTCMVMSLAHAQEQAGPDVPAAARAFQAAQRAQLEGDTAGAARLYELADSIAASPEALRSAIRSHVAAGSFARAATLALEAQRRYPDDAEAMALSGEVLAQHAVELGRLHVRCDVPCALVCDGQALGTESVQELDLFLAPGVHMIGARYDGDREREEPIELTAGELRELSMQAPPPMPTKPSQDVSDAGDLTDTGNPRARTARDGGARRAAPAFGRVLDRCRPHGDGRGVQPLVRARHARQARHLRAAPDPFDLRQRQGRGDAHQRATRHDGGFARGHCGAVLLYRLE